MTAFVDPVTGEIIDLDQVREVIEAWTTCGRPRMRLALRDQLLTIGTQLAPHKAELIRRLERGADLLGGVGEQANEPDPAKESLWFEWLAEYESVCDLLTTIGDGVLCGRWDDVSTRKDA